MQKILVSVVLLLVLVAAVPTGDNNNYLREIYTSEGPKLYGYLVKKTAPETAQDIVQEAFTRLFARLEKAADIGNVRAYLFQIARHLLYKETHDSQRKTANDSVLENLAADRGGNEGLATEERELMSVLGQCLSRLTNKERELFELRWNQGLTQVEIATVLKKSERQVRRDLEKLVTQLRSGFKDYGWPMDEAGIA